MKRFVHERSAVDMLHAFEDKLEDLQSSKNVEASDSPYEREVWELLDRKDILDYDGFSTKYSLYRNVDTDECVTVFGDPDLYRPEYGDFDAEFDSEEEAWEFYNDYEGFEDDDIY